MTYSLSHLSDGSLLRNLSALVARDRATTAELLAHIAEVDARRLHAPAGFPSMFAYCVRELGLSEDIAFKRIRAARVARRFPVLYEAITAGRLNVSGLVILAPHVTDGTIHELLPAAAGKTNAELELLLARRFPRPDLPEEIRAVSPPMCELAARPAGSALETGLAAPAQQGTSRPRITPLAPERFALQLTMSQAMHDKLQHAQALLSHQIPSGNVSQVLERALDALIRQLERAKFAATERPRPARRGSSSDPRHVPSHVKRAVWKRDQGQCTFVSDRGRRCGCRTMLEFDHAEPVARGGTATVAGLRLRCRAHNQHEAERVFGVDFIKDRRDAARRAAARGRLRAACDESMRPGTGLGAPLASVIVPGP